MSRQQLVRYVDEALAGLKDFQRATVDAVYRQMFEGEQRCMLVADEVGLGKTIVAKGIIAKKLKERLDAGKRTPLRVTYICSNQVIAHENVRKLNLFPSTVHLKKPVSRLVYLARDEEEFVEVGKVPQYLLELNSLTPATSFEVQNSSGLKDERAIIYALLCHDRKLVNRYKGLQWLLKGGVDKMQPYQTYLERMAEKRYQADLPRRFVRQLKRETLPKAEKAVYDNLRGWRARSVYDAVAEFAEMLDGRTEKTLHRGCLVLIHNLRRILIRCCLRYVNADLYILDEFQRFRDLIDLDNKEEEAIIAREVLLSKRASRVLLLSATPFKAFTSHDDVERGEDHHRDFRKVLEFLLSKDEAQLAHYDQHRQALYKQLLGLRKGDNDLNPAHRCEVETLLRKVICRTERNSVADDPAVMIDDQWREPLAVGVGDIANFAQTDQIVLALKRLKVHADKPVEFCKSAVYPLSFLDHYKIKEHLKDHKTHPDIVACLRQAKGAWLNFGDVHRYKMVVGGEANGSPSNARLTMLVEKAIGSMGAGLLWVPPSLAYYPLAGAFDGAANFTKTLLFSAWVMVPRVIGTLLSYEVERRTVGNPETRESGEKHERKYFTVEGKRRHPVPQIRFSRKGRDRDAQLRNMSNFCLLYPSLSLARTVDLVANLRDQLSLKQLRLKIYEQFQREIDQANLQQFTTPGGDSDRWYWAAPLLLDRSKQRLHVALDEWFLGSEEHDPWGRKTYFRGASENASAKELHFEHLRECYENPSATGLGPLPGDLAEVLSDLALGSPAVLTLRSLRRLFPEQRDSQAMVGAFDAADEFINLFNKPESIAAVRLGTGRQSYWQMVAKYCASGCLQAVLDEYFHVLKGQNVDDEGAISQLLGSVNLDTSSINVDDVNSFLQGEPRKMRCHYAVEFGSQRIETDEGGKRATNLREVFNSPFRPFVLATTSIGQEGLDFHSYCRRIVHWNLPGNPVDLEQREGRINRYKGLVIRQFLSGKYQDALGSDGANLSGDVWERLFELADRHERQERGKCELVPYWHVETDGIKIERIVPMYPFSSDQARLTKILKTLAVYRLAFGQPRQAELVEHLLTHDFSAQEMRQILDTLMIDLSPIGYDRKLDPVFRTTGSIS
jgi:hypothetical protein